MHARAATRRGGGDGGRARVGRAHRRRWRRRAPAGPAQLLLVASDVTEQRAAEQARLQAAIAQREVLVRGGAPPHQEQPAGRGRAAAAERRAPPRGGRRCSARRWARCRPSPRSTACRSAASGPLARGGVCCEAIARRCSAPSAAPIAVDVDAGVRALCAARGRSRSRSR
ncbi:MAG: hypothetical protein MZW92_00160 [Comamonadaceae bacterium]|nr:hypothetical protein [Comamonadaceae bacterium]